MKAHLSRTSTKLRLDVSRAALHADLAVGGHLLSAWALAHRDCSRISNLSAVRKNLRAQVRGGGRRCTLHVAGYGIMAARAKILQRTRDKEGTHACIPRGFEGGCASKCYGLQVLSTLNTSRFSSPLRHSRRNKRSGTHAEARAARTGDGSES
jgi:hypothetical protein